LAQANSCAGRGIRALRYEPISAGAAQVRRVAQGQRSPLAAFHEALAQLESGRSRAPVTVMLLGDSHTAAPLLAGRLRELFQGRFGSAGPGNLPPGMAQQQYRSALVSLSQSGLWNSFTARRSTTEGMFGLNMYRLRAEEGGAFFTASSREVDGIDRLEVTLVRAPGSGAVRLQVDGCVYGPFATALGQTQAQRMVAELYPGSHDVAVEAAGANLEILGWSLWRNAPGVILENHGVNGAEIAMLGNLDPSVLAGELAHSNPALIIVAFGTNEAFSHDWTEESYSAELVARLRALRAAAPNASILLVGPPDSAVRGRGPAPPPPRPGQRAQRSANCGWREPPNLAMVKTVQRRVASQLGLAYWDWSRLTRGPCGMHALSARQPPLVQPDHVHFTREGYADAAEALFRFLMERPGATGRSGSGRFGIF
jgi:lysophospholipase L1-like esterase